MQGSQRYKISYNLLSKSIQVRTLLKVECNRLLENESQMSMTLTPLCIAFDHGQSLYWAKTGIIIPDLRSGWETMFIIRSREGDSFCLKPRSSPSLPKHTLNLLPILTDIERTWRHKFNWKTPECVTTPSPRKKSDRRKKRAGNIDSKNNQLQRCDWKVNIFKNKVASLSRKQSSSKAQRI